MELRFTGELVYWRGPAPYLFVRLPPEPALSLQAVAGRISYGWGCVPVEAEIDGTAFTTALFPREGTYMLPLKLAIRRQLGPLDVGDRLAVVLRVMSKA